MPDMPHALISLFLCVCLYEYFFFRVFLSENVKTRKKKKIILKKIMYEMTLKLNVKRSTDANANVLIYQEKRISVRFNGSLEFKCELKRNEVMRFTEQLFLSFFFVENLN